MEGEPEQEHVVHSILEVKFPHVENISNLNSEETLFLVQWSCECCRGEESQKWLTLRQLVQDYSVAEVKIRMIEDSAKKQIKEQETRKQAAQLMSYLLFTDIDDLGDANQTKNFVAVDYESDN